MLTRGTPKESQKSSSEGCQIMSPMSSGTYALCCKGSVKMLDEFTVSRGERENDMYLPQSLKNLRTVDSF